MKKLTLLALIIALMSCGKDNSENEQNLVGTWILSNVKGSCTGVNLDADGNDIGCIDLPLLEVNCSIIEINMDGTLKYAYDLNEGTGSYTLDGDKANLCTDRCLNYTINGNILTLQTGTIELCDPVYTFRKTSSTLEELIEQNSVKFISKVTKNGLTYRTYEYNADGSLQQGRSYDNDGNITYLDVYTYTPVSATLERTSLVNNITFTYEYYNEAPTRLRRDKYLNGILSDYRLYFLEPNGCWVDRVEEYTNDQLGRLFDYNYTGENCDYQLFRYNQGQLESSTTLVKDGMKYWGESTLLNILQLNHQSNTLSQSHVFGNEVNPDLSWNSTFVYNEQGYPITETRTYLSGGVEIYTYTYE